MANQHKEERVVELRFDNAQFESAVSQTMESIKNLNAALKMQESIKGFEGLKNSLNSVDFSGMERNINALAVAFTHIGSIGERVAFGLIKTIKDGIGGAIREVISLPGKAFNQAKTGGWNRAMNIAKANFTMKGFLRNAEDADAKLKRIEESIMNAVDGTAYGYDEAAIAASSLMASNVAVGESMDKALLAISGVASMTGASYGEISDVFQSVAGNARLGGLELTRLSTRGLNAAAELGKQMGKTEQEVREMVRKGQIDFETFSNAMYTAFGDHAKDANDTFEGALANLKAAFNKIGADVASNAIVQFTKVLNSARKGVNAIRVVLRPFIDVLNKYLTKACEYAANALDRLTEWITNSTFYKYCEELKNAVSQTSSEIKDFSEIVSQVIRGDFGNGATRVKKLTEAGWDYATVQALVNKKIYGYDTALKDLTDEQIDAIAYDEDQAEALRKLRDNTETSSMTIGEATKKMEGITSIAGRFLAVIEILGNNGRVIFETIGKVLSKAFGDVFTKDGLIHAFETMTEELENFVKPLEVSEETISVFANIVKGVLVPVKELVKLVVGGWWKAFKFIIKISKPYLKIMIVLLDRLSTAIQKGVQKLKDMGKTVKDKLSKPMEKFRKKVLDPLWEKINNFADNFGTIFDNAVGKVPGLVSKFVSKVTGVVKKVFGFIRDELGKDYQTFKPLIDVAVKWIKILGENLKKLFETIIKPNAGKVKDWLSTVGKFLKGLFDKYIGPHIPALSGFIDKISSVFGEIIGSGNPFDKIREFIGPGIEALAGFIDSFIQANVDNFGSFGEFIGYLIEFAKSNAVKAWEAISTALTTVKDAIGGLIEKIPGFTDVLEILKEPFSDFVENLKTTVKNAPDFKSKIKSLKGSVKDFGKKVLESAKNSERFGTAIEKIEGFFGRLKKAVSDFIKIKIPNFFGKLADGAQALYDLLSQFGGGGTRGAGLSMEADITNVFGVLQKGLLDLIGLIRDFFGSFGKDDSTTTDMTDMISVDGVEDAVDESSFEKLKKKLKESVGKVMEFIELAFTNAAEFKTRASEAIQNFLQGLVDGWNKFSKDFNWGSVEHAGKLLLLVIILKRVADLIWSFKNTTDSAGKVGVSISKFFDALAGAAKRLADDKHTASFIDQLKSVSFICVALTACVYTIAQIPENDMKNATAALMALLLFAAIFVWALSRWEAMASASKVAKAKAKETAATAEATKEAAEKTAGAVSGVGVSLKEGLTEFGKQLSEGITGLGKNFGKNFMAGFQEATKIIAVGGAIWLIVDAIKKLSTLDIRNDQKVQTAIAAIIAILGMLLLVSKVMNIGFKDSHLSMGDAMVFVSMGAAVWIIGKAMADIAALSHDAEAFKRAEEVLIGIAICMVIMMGMGEIQTTYLSTATSKFDKMAIAIAILAISVKIIISCIGKIVAFARLFSWPEVEESFALLMAMMVGLSAILIYLTKADTASLKPGGLIATAAAVIMLAAAMDLMVVGLLALNFVRWESIVYGTLILGELFLLLLAMGSASAVIGTGVGVLLGAAAAVLIMSAAFGVFAASLVAISMFGKAFSESLPLVCDAIVSNAPKIFAAVLVVVTAVALAITAGSVVIANAAVAVVGAVIVAVLYALSQISPEAMEKAAHILVTGLLNLLRFLWAILMEAFEQLPGFLGDTIGRVAPDFYNALVEFLVGGVKILLAGFDKIASIFGVDFNLDEKFDEFVESIKMKTDEAEEALEDAANPDYSNYTTIPGVGVIEHNTEEIDNALQNQADTITEGGDEIDGAVNNVFGENGLMGSFDLTNMLDMTGEIGDVTALNSDAMKEYAGGFDIPLEDIPSMDTSSYDAFIGSMDKSEDISAQTDANVAALEENKAVVEEKVADLDTAYETNTEAVAAAGENKGLLYVTSMINALTGERGTTAASNFVSGLTDAIANDTSGNEAAVAYGEGIHDSLNEGLGVASPSWKAAESGQQYMLGLSNGLSEGSAGVRDTLIKSCTMMSMVTTLLITMQFLRMGRTASRSLGMGIRSGSSYASNASRVVAKQAANAIKSQTSAFRTAGVNAAKGFANGIRAGAYNARAAARDLGAGVITTLKKTMNERSPSKETMKIGSYGGEGFVIGLLRWASAAKNAGGEIASDALDAVRRSTSAISEVLNSGLDYNPVITPVLNLDSMNAGLYGLNSMLPSTVGINPNFQNSKWEERDAMDDYVASIKTDNADLLEAYNKQCELMSEMIELLGNVGIYLDGNTLVGHTINRIDKQLGNRTARAGRRN